MSSEKFAFPQHGFTSSPEVLKRMEGKGGMSMRQYYKAAALLYIAAKANDWQDEPYIVAETCGRYADAMLAEDEEHAKLP